MAHANVGDRIKLKSANKFEEDSEINVRLINFKTGRRSRKKTKCRVLSCCEYGESYELQLEVLENE